MKVQKLYINFSDLPALLSGKARIKEFPDDAEVVSLYQDNRHIGMAVLLVKSEEYEEIGPYMQIPGNMFPLTIIPREEGVTK